MRSFLGLIFFLIADFYVFGANNDVKSKIEILKMKFRAEEKLKNEDTTPTDSPLSSPLTMASIDDEKMGVYVYSEDKIKMSEAWISATKLTDRNPKIWRVDNHNNVILTNKCTISSPLAFRALMKTNIDNREGIKFEAVQMEYINGNQGNGLKYLAKNDNQDNLLSIIEIALKGHVSDNKGLSYCWCPSNIHQDLFSHSSSARAWHTRLYNYETKYGMAGHNIIFQDMGIGLKDIRHIPEHRLDAFNQVYDFMYIQNFQPQCSDVVNVIDFEDDTIKRAHDMNNNWGLPRVTPFITVSSSSSASSTSILNPKKVPAISSYASATKSPYKNKLMSSVVMNDNDWPSLSVSSSGESNKKLKASAPVTFGKTKSTTAYSANKQNK